MERKIRKIPAFSKPQGFQEPLESYQLKGGAFAPFSKKSSEKGCKGTLLSNYMICFYVPDSIEPRLSCSAVDLNSLEWINVMIEKDELDLTDLNSSSFCRFEDKILMLSIVSKTITIRILSFEPKGMRVHLVFLKKKGFELKTSFVVSFEQDIPMGENFQIGIDKVNLYVFGQGILNSIYCINLDLLQNPSSEKRFETNEDLSSFNLSKFPLFLNQTILKN